MTFSRIFWLALAESRGAGRRFLFFALCLAIGVGAVMTLKSFSGLLANAIQKESKGLLAADIEIRSSWPQNEHDLAFQRKVLPAGTDFLFVRELNAIGYDGPLSVEWEDSGMERFRGGTEACAFVKNVNISPNVGAFDDALKAD